METGLTINAVGGAVVESRVDFEGLTSAFLRSADVGAKSGETYKAGLTKFMKWAAGRGIVPTHRTDIIAYRDWLQSNGNEKTGGALKPGAVATYMAAVKAFFTFAEVEYGYKNISKNIKAKRNDSRRHKKDYLTAQQAKTVLNSIDRGTPEGRRDYALMLLLITCGLRTIEAARASVEDIRNKGANAYLFVQGKGHDDKEDSVRLPTNVESAIRAHLKDRRNATGDAPLFASLSDNNPKGHMNPQSISHIVKARLRAAGFDDERLTAHSLRHTAVTLTLMAGATLQEAQGMARHASINTTMIYAQNIESENNTATLRVAAMLAEAA